MYIFELIIQYENLNSADSKTLSTWVKNEQNWKYQKNKSQEDNVFTLIFRPSRGEISMNNSVRFEQLLNMQKCIPANKSIILKEFPKVMSNVENVILKLTDTKPGKLINNVPRETFKEIKIYEFDFNSKNKMGHRTVWEYICDYNNIVFESSLNGTLDNEGNPLCDVILRLPKELQEHFLFELNIKFDSMNSESSKLLREWIEIPNSNNPRDNWEYDLNENKGYFTLAFRKTQMDILYFKQITLEQRINRQKKYKNDRIILRNWPVNIPKILDIVLKLTPQGEDIDKNVHWDGLETQIIEYSFNTEKPKIVWN